MWWADLCGEEGGLGRVLAHGVPHDVVGVAGEALHGRAVQLARVRLGEGCRGAGVQGEGWHLETSQHNTGLLSPANPLLAIHRRRVLYCTTGCIVVVVQKYI